MQTARIAELPEPGRLANKRIRVRILDQPIVFHLCVQGTPTVRTLFRLSPLKTADKGAGKNQAHIVRRAKETSRRALFKRCFSPWKPVIGYGARPPPGE